MAFNPDGSQFAFSAGHEAKLWDVATGKELKSWQLNEGLADLLAFAGPDKLLLFRMETRDGKTAPFNNREHPRVCRLRNLLGKDPDEPAWEITDFPIGVSNVDCTPDGQYFAAGGPIEPSGSKERLLVFDHQGRELYRSPPTAELGSLAFDPTGSTLAAQMDPKRSTLLEMPSGKYLGTTECGVVCLTRGAAYWARPSVGDAGDVGLWLFRNGADEPLTLCKGQHVPTVRPQFDSSGTLLAWGVDDGTVYVCNVVELQRRLAGLDLDW
jgi:WD40 repeat protein